MNVVLIGFLLDSLNSQGYTRFDETKLIAGGVTNVFTYDVEGVHSFVARKNDIHRITETEMPSLVLLKSNWYKMSIIIIV